MTLAVLALAFYGGICLALVLLRFVDPFTTAVQMERRVSSWTGGPPYRKQYRFEPLSRISLQLQHAVIAAEDAKFYQHHGFDWKEIDHAVHEDLKGGRRRGASTITQQLVRNLFLSTAPSLVRKGAEFALVPPTEAILGKRRILELYLNVIEWGRGIYGAEAAAESYYHVSARQLTREQSAQLAALLPAPLHRKPGRVEWYASVVRTRMREMGW